MRSRRSVRTGTTQRARRTAPSTRSKTQRQRVPDHGGASWSAAAVIDQPGPTTLDVAGRMLVLPDRDRRHPQHGPGVLLAVFARADLATGVGGLFAARSLDEGRSRPGSSADPMPGRS
jgi:hypothetical protein